MMGMPPTARLFESEEKAREAVSALIASRLSEDSVTLMPASDAGPSTSDDIAKAIIERHQGWVPANHAKVWATQVRAGKSLVLVSPPYGGEKQIVSILDAHDPVYVWLPEPDRAPLGSTPFSDFLGLPVLSRRRRIFAGRKGSFMSWLAGDEHDTRFSLSSLFVLPLLSSRHTFLSSLFGLDTLTRSPRRDSRFGMPLTIDDPTPLSTKTGMPTLTESLARTGRSFGMPLLINDPTPLSSLIGMPTLIRRKRGGDSAAPAPADQRQASD